MSKEIVEIENGIARLKKINKEQKKLIDDMRKERDMLLERCRYLTQKFNEVYATYEEASRRILKFVESQTDPIYKRIEALEDKAKILNEIRERLRTHASTIQDILNSKKDMEKRISELESISTSIKDSVSKLGDLLEDLNKKEKQNEKRINIVRNILEKRDDEYFRKIKIIQEDAARNFNKFQNDVNKKISLIDESIKDFTTKLQTIDTFVKNLNVLEERVENHLDDLRRYVDNRFRAEEKERTSHITSLTKTQSNLSSELKNLKTILDKTIEEIKKDINENQLTEKTLEDRIASLKEEFNHNIKSSFNELKLFQEELTKTLNNLELNIERHISSSTKLFQDLKDKTKTQELNEKDLRKALEALDKQTLETITKLRSDIEKRISQTELIIKEIDTKLAGMERFIKSLDLSDEKIEERIDEIKTKLEERITQRIKDIESRISLLGEKSNLKLSKHIEELKSKLASSNSKILKIESSLESLKKEIEDLSAEMAESEIVDDVKSRIEDMRIYFESKNEESEKNILDLSKNFERRISDINSRLKHLESVTGDLKTQINAIRLSDEGIETKLESTKVYFEEKLKSLTKSFEAKLTALRSDIEAMISEVKEREERERERLYSILQE
ncbi:MAG: hypothetical protein DRP15_00120 [Candidatus Aenigmatarchaeota archaeon]|nr:MAG: hypothetical protein DRP15_00120 [Candidatus Aenigmarchaeota archaeon]